MLFLVPLYSSVLKYLTPQVVLSSMLSLVIIISSNLLSFILFCLSRSDETPNLSSDWHMLYFILIRWKPFHMWQRTRQEAHKEREEWDPQQSKTWLMPPHTLTKVKLVNDPPWEIRYEAWKGKYSFTNMLYKGFTTDESKILHPLVHEGKLCQDLCNNFIEQSLNRTRWKQPTSGRKLMNSSGQQEEFINQTNSQTHHGTTSMEEYSKFDQLRKNTSTPHPKKKPLQQQLCMDVYFIEQIEKNAWMNLVERWKSRQSIEDYESYAKRMVKFDNQEEVQLHLTKMRADNYHHPTTKTLTHSDKSLQAGTTASVPQSWPMFLRKLNIKPRN